MILSDNIFYQHKNILFFKQYSWYRPACYGTIVLFFNFFIIMAKNTLPVTYTLRMPQPHTHYFEVEIQIPDTDESDALTLQLPVWTPGSYLVREFSRHIERAEAFNEAGAALKIAKTDKNTWQVIHNKSKAVTVRYGVYAYELTVRTSFLDSDKAYINGANLFCWIEGREKEASILNIEAAPEWKQFSTALPKKNIKNNIWQLQIANYDTLVDSPILIGNHEVYEFKAAGVPHEVAITAPHNADIPAMLEHLTKIAETETAIFGEHPCEHYVYIILNSEKDYGGLEHLNSTSLLTSRFGYSNDAYTGFLGLTAHEYFHLWNVKRLRPIELGPFDYGQENYTELLWQAEGFTSYYDDFTLRRAGIISSKDYLNLLVKSFNYTANTHGCAIESLAAASYDAWIKYYRRNENSDNAQVSYYTKGAQIAFMLDMEIRRATKGTKNLDNVLRNMYEKYYKQLGRGFTRNEIKAEIETISGKNFDDFFTNYIEGTAPININKFLEVVGLEAVNTATNTAATLGVNTKTEEGRTIVSTTPHGGNAYEAGINVNDEIVALNNYRIKGNLSDLMKQFKNGDTINVLISRDGILRTIPVYLQPSKQTTYQIKKLDNASEEQKLQYQAWIQEAF